MLKKVLAATVLTMGSSLALAGTMGTPCPTYNYQVGPYLGGSIGPMVNVAGAPSFYQGFTGTLSAGWGQVWNNQWYLAGEFFGGSNIKMKSGSTLGNFTSVDSTWNWGFDVLPGIMLNERVLGYARVGVISTHFNVISETKTGWQVGVGGQTNVYQNLDLRGEYIYSQYSDIDFVGTPRTNQFQVGLIYKFA